MDGTYLGGSPNAHPIADDPLVGTIVDRRYRVDALIGEGGMARVYRVTHTLIGRVLAIKVLRPELHGDHALVERFLREARCASAVKHPHVVELCDYGELPEGGAFYVMEYLRGRSLAERIDREGPLPPEEALSLALQICCGLEAIHEQGIVHRDLKADNVFLCQGSHGVHAKVLDFGVAKGGNLRLTAVGAILGTPEYMSPEQAQGQEADARSDLYSLGVLVFEMLTGFVPFASKDVALTLESHIRAEPPRLRDVRPELTARLVETEQVILTLMAKDRNLRLASASAARDELQRALVVDLGRESADRIRSTLPLGSNRVIERRSVEPRVGGGAPWHWESPGGPPAWAEPSTGSRTRRRFLRQGQARWVVGGVAIGTAVFCGTTYAAWVHIQRSSISAVLPGVNASSSSPQASHADLAIDARTPVPDLAPIPVVDVIPDERTQKEHSASSAQEPTMHDPQHAAAPPRMNPSRRPTTGEGPASALVLPSVDTPTDPPPLLLDELLETPRRTNSAGDLKDPFGEK